MRNALRNIAIASTVIAASVSTSVLAVPTIWESNFGSAIVNGDDVTTNAALGFAFPFLGNTYSSAEVSTNGFLSLGGFNGQGCCNGDVPNFLGGAPRISIDWFDIVGTVFLNTSVSGRAVLTWQGFEFFVPGRSLTAQAQIFANGTIVFGYSGQNFAADHDILIGLTGGNNAANPGPSNLAGPSSISTGSVGTVFQCFNAAIFSSNCGLGGTAPSGFADFSGLQDQNLIFRPNGNGGWNISSAVPEPASWAMMIAGFGLAGIVMRRRTKVSVTYARSLP